MKKSLIALAVLAASGAAMAQSSVTLYGVVDVNITYEDTGVDSVTKVQSGDANQSGSRWGLKGAEDLGSGLKAIFTLESGFSADDGQAGQGGRLFGRQSWVGLQGGFGTVKLGRQMNPIYANSGTFDPFADGLAGDSAFLMNYQSNRTDNTITYNYSANGFRGELQYGAGEVAGDSSANSMWGGFFGYTAGPIDVVATYETKSNATGNDDQSVWLIGGNYNFGVAKLFLTYEKEDGFGTLDRSHWLVGTTVPLGGGSLILSYIARQDDAVNADANLFAIGYTYDLSKRTNLYTSYGSIGNDDNSKVRVTKAGETNNLFNVGVRHKF